MQTLWQNIVRRPHSIFSPFEDDTVIKLYLAGSGTFNSFVATCGAIAYAGLIPKVVDVGEDLNIDVTKIRKVTKRTKLRNLTHTTKQAKNSTDAIEQP